VSHHPPASPVGAGEPESIRPAEEALLADVRLCVRRIREVHTTLAAIENQPAPGAGPSVMQIQLRAGQSQAICKHLLAVLVCEPEAWSDQRTRSALSICRETIPLLRTATDGANSVVARFLSGKTGLELLRAQRSLQAALEVLLPRLQAADAAAVERLASAHATTDEYLEVRELWTAQLGVEHVVALVHGIRTRAAWEEMVKTVLEENPRVVVRPIKYTYLSAIGFAIPFLRRFALREVKDKLAAISRETENHSGAILSVIAHSFGTYAVGKALASDTSIRVRRLVLCGSVLSEDFGWELLIKEMGLKPVNDCGLSDRYPILAASLGVGFGSTGSFGFGSPHLEDRFHIGGHAVFFSESFVREYWVPFVEFGAAHRSGNSPNNVIWSWPWAVLPKVRLVLTIPVLTILLIVLSLVV
jgi:hypothetical protein